MKQKLKKEDISCLLYILNQTLDGCYCTQIYDGNKDNTRKVVFKFRYKSEVEVKFYYLMIESGINMYILDEFQSVRSSPSSLVSKLRKSFKEKRLWPLCQLNNDNIIDIRFSNEYHFIVELYDKGNFIITNDNYKIIYLIRNYERNQQKIEINQIYPFDTKCENFDEYKDNKGYIIKNNTFSPFPIEGSDVIEFDTFNEALKEYFKEEQIIKEKKIKNKIKNNKNDHNKKKGHVKAQINKLEFNEEKLMNKGDTFIENIYYYQSIIDFIQNYITYTRDFNELTHILKDKYQKEIKVTHENLFIDDYEIDYTKSAFENVKPIYQKKKVMTKKKEKAIHIYDQIKIKKEKNNEIEKIDMKRKIHKFEEYNWCIIDNFIIICGKSADENEKILSQCDKNDILIHGHFDKSPWAVIKNPEKKEISIKIIDYAGQFLVHHSWNWVENCTNKAYYTYPDKISKSAPSGEFMGKGSRMVHEKHILSNADMNCALTILFSINGEFCGNPKKEDIIDYAMVMCCPYQVANDFIFKAKIKPTGTKKDKGRKKLIESIKSKFMKLKINNEILKSYIKSIPQDEWDKVCIHYFSLN